MATQNSILKNRAYTEPFSVLTNQTTLVAVTDCKTAIGYPGSKFNWEESRGKKTKEMAAGVTG
jgi:hypothetical protein